MQIKTTSHASEIAVDDGVVLKYPFLKLCKNLLPALSTYSWVQVPYWREYCKGKNDC